MSRDASSLPYADAGISGCNSSKGTREGLHPVEGEREEALSLAGRVDERPRRDSLRGRRDFILKMASVD